MIDCKSVSKVSRNLYTVCPTSYRTRHFFNNFTTNEDIATKFEADLPHCLRNVTTSYHVLEVATICVQTGLKPARHILESPCPIRPLSLSEYLRWCLLSRRLWFVVCFGKFSLSDIPIRNSQAVSDRASRVAKVPSKWCGRWHEPLLRVATIRRTADTFLFISHTTNVLLFKFRCNIFIGVRIIKEMPGSVASGTHCILWCHFSTHWHVMNLRQMNYVVLVLENKQFYREKQLWWLRMWTSSRNLMFIGPYIIVIVEE